MKKIYLLLLMLGLFAMPSITTEAALAPPALYDYSFVYDATDGEFQFKDGTNSYTPEFTRTADGIYFNYEYIGDGDGLLPFEVTLRFNRSNTSWTFGTTGYIATDTKIGSNNTVGSISNKFLIKTLNPNLDDYVMYFDTSSSPNDYSMNHNIIIDNIFYRSYNYAVPFRSASYIFAPFIIQALQGLQISNSGSSAVYVDALYWFNIGTNLAAQTTQGYQNGFTDGFGEGYLQGVQEDNAYALGYARGLSEGQDMETGSSILIFVVAAIGFIMMIFGFTTKRGIFNLLSVGAFVVLGAMLAQYIGFIIIAIGLVLINVYYAFWGDL